MMEAYGEKFNFAATRPRWRVEWWMVGCGGFRPTTGRVFLFGYTVQFVYLAEALSYRASRILSVLVAVEGVLFWFSSGVGGILVRSNVRHRPGGRRIGNFWSGLLSCAISLVG